MPQGGAGRAAPLGTGEVPPTEPHPRLRATGDVSTMKGQRDE